MSLTVQNNSTWTKVLFVLIATFLAFVFGMISVTANPIFIGLAVGLVGGIILLTSPKKTIWLVIALGLATPALLDMGGHGLSKILWAVSIMSLLLWLPGLMNLFDLNKNQHNKYIPTFIWLAISFVLFSMLSALLEHYSLSEFLTGFKRYFQSFGLLLVLVTLNISKQDVDKWLRLLLAIALLQLPFSLFELFILVPLRGGISAAGAEATDIVAGTMGANLNGGSPNALMVTFVLIVFVFIFSRWRVGLVTTSKLWLYGLILLLPLGLGETKVVVFMLPIIGLVLLRKDMVKHPVRYIPVIVALAGLTIAFAYLYVYVMLDTTFADAYKISVQYNLKDVGYGTSLLNRTTVMSFWWKLQSAQDPIGFLFGNGLGSSYGSGLQAGHIAAKYPGYGISLTTVSTLLWDVGVFGLTLYLTVYVAAWRAASKLWRQTASNLVKADALAIQVAIALTLMFTIYSDSQINLIMHEIILSMVFGYLAFLVKQQHKLEQTALAST
ncbi:MAG: hypothetical protein H7Z18_04575 [Methylophilaceae bacterium]|nr:hypothetical protein [Methylophilaceae bacterium]